MGVIKEEKTPKESHINFLEYRILGFIGLDDEYLEGLYLATCFIKKRSIQFKHK